MIKKAYAKLNLFLNVKEKRPDGFHNLEMINIMINLYDELEFIPTDGEVKVVVLNNKDLNGKNNLAYKVAVYLKKAYKIESGVKILINKNIPVGGGLGGGSSDAACALLALNEFWKLGMSFNEMFELSKKFGSDTPYCLYQEPAIVTGVGFDIKPVDIDISDFDISLYNKGINVSTGNVFKNLKNYNKFSLDEAVKLLQSNKYEEFICGLNNDLQDTVFELYPEVKNQYETIKRIHGEDGVFMTGSGSTIVRISRRK